MNQILKHKISFLYQIGQKYYMIGKNLCECISPNEHLKIGYYKYVEGDEKYIDTLGCPVCVFAYKDVIRCLEIKYSNAECKDCKEVENMFTNEEKDKIKNQYKNLIEFERKFRAYIG